VPCSASCKTTQPTELVLSVFCVTVSGSVIGTVLHGCLHLNQENKLQGVTNTVWSRNSRMKSPVKPKCCFLIHPQRQNLQRERIPGAGVPYCRCTCSSGNGETGQYEWHPRGAAVLNPTTQVIWWITHLSRFAHQSWDLCFC